MAVAESTDIRFWRLCSQQLCDPGFTAPEDLTAFLGGIQAQDYAGGLWSIGLRLREGMASAIESAVAARRIVRTWAYRGTLHFLAAADVRWVTSLLAPTILAANRRRYEQLGLDEGTFTRSEEAIGQALAGGQALTRAEIAAVLEAGGVSAAGQRAPYLLQRAALDGLICQGTLRGREPTYVLLSDWLPPAPVLDHELALAELAWRYFTSHGPATLQDFRSWSGLSSGGARRGLEAVKPSLEQVVAHGIDLWGARYARSERSATVAHLLPPFDEFLLGYKDRTPVLEPAHVAKVNAGGGMPRPTILVDGQVVGVWKRQVSRGSLLITAELFEPPSPGRLAIEQAARRFGTFHGLSVEVHF